MSEYIKFRIKFEKTGIMKYISHLDLNRLFARALARAQIELLHSEGFNPHPKITFGSALSLGTESLCEFADVKITKTAGLETGEEILKKTKGAFPPGINIIEVYAPESDFKTIDKTRFHIFLKPQGFGICELEQLFSGDVSVEKKPGNFINLKDYICDIAVSRPFEAPEYILADIVLKTNPQLFLGGENIIKAINFKFTVDDYLIRKIETYDKNGDIFA